jgi:bifunctional NMN adenylyltransferase/nudix hydrolase
MSLSVYIGRFQPVHVGHLETLRRGLQEAERLLVLIGSSNVVRTTKNPFTFEERVQLLRNCLTPEENSRITIKPIRDYLYNDTLWTNQVHQRVREVSKDGEEIILIGKKKDASSYYLNLFPGFRFVDAGTGYVLNATDVRNAYFVGAPNFPPNILHPSTEAFLIEFMNRSVFTDLCAEKNYLDRYKASWQFAPYPPIFVAADCVVIKSGHVLLIKRKGPLGKGQLALPGGFVEQSEGVVDAALRELKEETQIEVTEDILRRRISDSFVFDHPERSLRGRVISHALLINLQDGLLPHTVASDDAVEHLWVPIRDLWSCEDQMFEDHFHIISHFIFKKEF